MCAVSAAPYGKKHLALGSVYNPNERGKGIFLATYALLALRITHLKVEFT